MKLDEMIAAAKDSMTVGRVFGDPYEKDGLTVIPAVRVMGGAGGGAGQDDEGQQGEGGGFGMNASPAGVYVIRNGAVQWQPAVDANRVVAAVAGVLVAAMLSRALVARARSRVTS